MKLGKFFSRLSEEQKGTLTGGSIATLVFAGGIAAAFAVVAAPITVAAVTIGGFAAVGAGITTAGVKYSSRKKNEQPPRQ